MTTITQFSNLYEYDTFPHCKNSMKLCVTAGMTLYVMQKFVWHSTSLREYDTKCMTQKVRPIFGAQSTKATLAELKKYFQEKLFFAKWRLTLVSLLLHEKWRRLHSSECELEVLVHCKKPHFLFVQSSIDFGPKWFFSSLIM